MPGLTSSHKVPPELLTIQRAVSFSAATESNCATDSSETAWQIAGRLNMKPLA